MVLTRSTSIEPLTQYSTTLSKFYRLRLGHYIQENGSHQNHPDLFKLLDRL